METGPCDEEVKHPCKQQTNKEQHPQTIGLNDFPISGFSRAVIAVSHFTIPWVSRNPRPPHQSPEQNNQAGFPSFYSIVSDNRGILLTSFLREKHIILLYKSTQKNVTTPVFHRLGYFIRNGIVSPVPRFPRPGKARTILILDPPGIKPGAMKLDLSLVPEPVKRLQEILGPVKSYVVGGILRDSLAGARLGPEGIITQTAGNDWDLATPLPPREVLSRLRRAGVTAVPIGFEHGTVAAVIDGVSYEITTFRHDLEYRDGRHPTVRFAQSLEDDLMRRDFTVNALALDLESGEILDLFGGLRDLRDRIIRTVGDPEFRFREDYLRMLRATRFAAKLEGPIEPETRAAVLRNAPLIQNVSPERVREEILKLLSYRQPSQGFAWMHDTGLLLYILPELESGFGVGQNRFHADDVAWHTLHAVDALDPRYPFLRFVTLMHDLGKVPAKRYMPHKDDYVFYGHQYVGKRMTRRIMRRLRFSNKEIETASAIVENHMYNLKPDLSEGASRRFIRKLGRENVEGFLRMRMADRKGNHLNDDGYEKGIFHFVRSLRKITRAEDALTVQKLRVNGYDLMEMGLKPGPVFSRILNGILEEVLDDPSLNERAYLLGRARALVEEFQRTGDVQIHPGTHGHNEEDEEAKEEDAT